MKRLALYAAIAVAPAVLGGCATMTNGPRASATNEQLDACSSRADEIYALRNPADAMQGDNEASSVGSPFSGPVGRSQPQLLAGQHARDALVTQCLNGQTGTATINVKRPRSPAPPSPQ